MKQFNHPGKMKEWVLFPLILLSYAAFIVGIILLGHLVNWIINHFIL